MVNTRFAEESKIEGHDPPDDGQVWRPMARIGHHRVPRRPNGSADRRVEVATNFALDQEVVPTKCGQVPPLEAGDEVHLARPRDADSITPSAAGEASNPMTGESTTGLGTS